MNNSQSKPTSTTTTGTATTGTANWVEPFKVVSITKSDGPGGDGEKDWYRYEISQGRAPIIGHRRGTRESVTEAANDVVLCLNERLTGKKGRVHLKPREKR